MKRGPLAATTLLLAIALAPARADALERWYGHATPGGGHAVMFADPEDGESLRFLARCETPGAPATVYHHSMREHVAGQATDSGGMRERVERLAIELAVDGERFAYADAHAQPEEMYGGNEIGWTTSVDDPLFPALIRGQNLSLVLDGEAGDEVSLRGSAGPVRAFVEGCAP